MQQKKKYDLIYGPHAIIELLKAGKRKLISIYTTKPLPKAMDRINKHLKKKVPNIQYVSSEVLTRMAGASEHSGVVALVSPFKYIVKPFHPSKRKFILLLDGIKDVRNLGAILRSAYCTGVNGIVICKRGGASITPSVFKTSAGLVEYLDIYQANSIGAAVSELKNAGYNLYMSVAGLENGTDATKVEYKDPVCLVIGSEERGIDKGVRKNGTLITLPQRDSDISYNASVATGILLFTISNKTGQI